MTGNPSAAIVVGIDGSARSLHPLDRAAREGPAPRRSPRVVHASGGR